MPAIGPNDAGVKLLAMIGPLAFLLLAGSDGHDAAPPTDEQISNGPLSRAQAERLRREMVPFLDGLTPLCNARLLERGFEGLDGVPLHDCFESTPPRRWRGLWRDVFEGSRFCPWPAIRCSDAEAGPHIWLNLPQSLPLHGSSGAGGLYAIEFIGRRTLRPGRFGHFGMSDHEMTVERLISIREIEPPPRQPAR